MLQLHFLFLGNVATHWVALMSGIASVIVATWETIRGRSLLARGFAAVAVVCLMVACDMAWQDEHRNTETVKQEKAAEVAAKNTCLENRLIADAYTRGIEGLNQNQRETIDHLQTTNNVQQADVSSCVVSLGKMNPKVREEIVVVEIPLYTTGANGKVNVFTALKKKYISEIFITTNETESTFHGFLKCDNPYTPITAPALPGGTQTVMVTIAPPAFITEREYEISASTSGNEWSPARPAYLQTASLSQSLGRCTFTPR